MAPRDCFDYPLHFRELFLGVLMGALGLASPRADEFSEVAAAVGINHSQSAGTVTSAVEAHFMTGGAAAVDLDNDGWPDLVMSRFDRPSVIYRNQLGRFVAIEGPSVGIDLPSGGNGVAAADIDNDGDQDLYFSTVGGHRNYLFINQGNGTFTEAALERGVAVENRSPAPGYRSYAFSGAFGDYDRDGWVDLFTTSWLDLGTGPGPAGHPGGVANRLLRNRGSSSPGFFQDTTLLAGVTMNHLPNRLSVSDVTFGFTPRFADFDGDGWCDLAVASDFGSSRLFWNRGDGTFQDGSLAAGIGGDENGMGSATGDFDGDGRLDWFVSSIYDAATLPDGANWGRSGNRLYRNLGGRRFEDATSVAGVRDGGWGWGTTFFDYDNDGDLDLILANGMDYPGTSMENRFNEGRVRLWQNDGAGSFVERGLEAGFAKRGSAKGLFVFDFDLDGDLDVFVVFHAGLPALYRNNLAITDRWLRLRLIGGISNRDAINAQVWIEGKKSDGSTHAIVREVDGGSNFLGQNERIIHFGLNYPEIRWERGRVRWPSGIDQVFSISGLGQTLTLHEPVSFPHWVDHWFGNFNQIPVNQRSDTADPDQDGSLNWAEYCSGTDPLDSFSAPIVNWRVSSQDDAKVLELSHPYNYSAEAKAVPETAETVAGPWAPITWETPSLDDRSCGVKRVRFPLGGGTGYLRVKFPSH